MNRVHPELCISLGERQLGLSLLHCLPSSTHPPLLATTNVTKCTLLDQTNPIGTISDQIDHQVNDHEDLVTVSYAESWLVRYISSPHHLLSITNTAIWVSMFYIWKTEFGVMIKHNDRPQERTRHTSTKWCILMIGLTPQITKVIHPMHKFILC